MISRKPSDGSSLASVFGGAFIALVMLSGLFVLINEVGSYVQGSAVEFPDVGGGVCALAVGAMLVNSYNKMGKHRWVRTAWVILACALIVVGVTFLACIALFFRDIDFDGNPLDGMVGLIVGVIGPIGSGFLILISPRRHVGED